ncbi:MAG: tetratricopeptide repeat protein [Flavobacteriaceae bacterium]|jgi:tetratricopeptide (TPR) repeat protein|nr:tetratricopeptide repeat protein [Flavobacteriaceae bacterium]
MTKHIIYIVALLFTSFVNAQETSWQKDFEHANQTYEKEHFEDAVKEYQAIANKIDNSPELYYNLANAYYKTRDIINAIYYYEKALKLAPEDKKIAINLNFAQKDLKDDIVIVKEYDKQDIVHQSLSKLSSDGWAKTATAIAFLLLACFIIYYLANNATIKRISFSVMIFGVLLFGGSLYAAHFEANYSERTPPAIIFEQKVAMKEEAKNTSKTLKELHGGTKVYILETKALWIKIRLDNQEEGWIEKNTVKEI